MIDLTDQPGITLARGRSDRRLLHALAALAGVVIVGTVGFRIIEGWDLWRSFFFTLITITTVGYGDEGISEPGRMFTTVLLVGDIGIASYTFTLVVQSAVVAELTWRPRMKKRIDALREHTIVCGFGRVGRTVCEKLKHSGIPFVVVEQTPQGFRSACEMGYLAIEGAATEDEPLLCAGIQRAKHVVAGVDSQAANIVITLTARELNPDVIIVARAEQPSHLGKLRRAGATRVVAPFQSGGVEIANAILDPNACAPLASAGSQSGVALAEILVEEGSSLVGRGLDHYGPESARVALVGLLRPGKTLRIPARSNEPVRAKDIIVVAGIPDEIEKLRRQALAP